ncbi:hypothetical protein CBR_g4030, partial [Chara braunii]
IVTETMAATAECNSVCGCAKEKVAECWYIVLLKNEARGMIFDVKEIADGQEVVAVKTKVGEITVRETVVLKTAAVETAAVETAAVETVAVDTAAVETATVETAGVETAAVETAGVETAAVETAVAADEQAGAGRERCCGEEEIG